MTSWRRDTGIIDTDAIRARRVDRRLMADARRARFRQCGGLQKIAENVAIVPSLWWFELRNMLIVNERRGRLDESMTARALLLLNSLPVMIDDAVQEVDLLRLARRHKLAVYDTAYLELALRRGLPLATLDNALAHAAGAESVALIGRSAA